MTRSSSWLTLLVVLALGLVVGMAIERAGPTVAAQDPGPPANKIAASRPSTESPADRAQNTVKPQPREKTEASSTSSNDALYRELDKQYERFEEFDRTFEMVAKAVSPAVVHIVARKASIGDEKPSRTYEETGSGVIVRDGGRPNRYVLTNNHVIEDSKAAEIKISLRDGRMLHPLRVWSDSKADIAVLDLGANELPWVRLGDSDSVQVGTWVLAMGSPFGLTHSVSHGIISARGRHEEELQVDGVENQDFLQTDAAINPGNSGGPLVNMRGEVIGINTAIASNGGGSEGVGFSIPINLAKWSMRQLLANGKVSRGAMGVDLNDLKPEAAVLLGLERPRGARVVGVHPDSPAFKAGMQKDDVVIRFNGVEVADLNHLINLVSMAAIGRPAAVIVWRSGASVELDVVVADRDSVLSRLEEKRLVERQPPSPANGLMRRPRRIGPDEAPQPNAAAGKVALGLELQTLDSAWSRRLGLPETSRGAAVVKVDPASPLTKHVRTLDVIETIDGRPMKSAEEVVHALGEPVNQKPREIGLRRKVGESFEHRIIQVP